MKIARTDHLGWEILHGRKVGHRPGEPPPLGPSGPVPWCECARCRLLRYAEFPGLEPGVFDVLMHQVLPELAAVIPMERMARAVAARREWCSIGVEFPPADLLAELAATLPGARKDPPPVREDRDRLPVEEARKASILEVCDRLGIELRRAGKRYRGSCPFHDSSSGTSFSVDPEGNVWYCFGCTEGGDAIDLLARAKGLDFAGAVKELAS